ncbi:MAG: helix-turn-helix transcriptional regulator [Clostridia bacterium]|nr:helix-turn-helix transcriptional regulator [Clostridia bacterium]MBQ6531178.1 helix-turn-helix transcriptional regulator [Clostridia bacterium]MBQ7717846.1 helix-turn-helix transcriptional regulator [Clostridia bacterium]MBQ9599641.1 helix-turn-helix transcriptional regulator [Clostridia bacterium]MBR0088672.1 helix-turn-helix transcriptional regulator [Clostridia bacterium]
MRLKDLREDLDLTQKQVADILNVKQNTYSQYENGIHELPLDALIKLARFYGTSTDYILRLTDEPKPYPKSRQMKI